MAGKSPGGRSPWLDLAAEAFVTGLCMAAGEALISETVRAVRRWRKRKRKPETPDPKPTVTV